MRRVPSDVRQVQYPQKAPCCALGTPIPQDTSIRPRTQVSVLRHQHQLTHNLFNSHKPCFASETPNTVPWWVHRLENPTSNSFTIDSFQTLQITYVIQYRIPNYRERKTMMKAVCTYSRTLIIRFDQDQSHPYHPGRQNHSHWHAR
jgi:hypothetical protein